MPGCHITTMPSITNLRTLGNDVETFEVQSMKHAVNFDRTKPCTTDYAVTLQTLSLRNSANYIKGCQVSHFLNSLFCVFHFSSDPLFR